MKDTGSFRMLQISMVHAEADAAIARDFGSYLERNCRVRMDYPIISRTESVLEVVARALSCDVLVLFVSPNSVPRRLNREEWEPLFVQAAGEHGTRLGYVVVGECAFPKVLLRNNVFPSRREVKNWVLTLEPIPERLDFAPKHSVGSAAGEALDPLLWLSIVDRPGSARVAGRDAAASFARQVEADFQGILWVECGGAIAACAAGDLGAQLGMHLTGELPANLERIRGLCNQYRCLVVLVDASEGVKGALGELGLTSVLLAEASPTAVTLEQARRQFEALCTWVNGVNEVPPSGWIHETVEWLATWPEHWLFASQFARGAIAFYKFHERFAELFELTDMMLNRAIERRDRDAANEFAQERAWILEEWGRPPESVHPFAAEQAPAVQLGLF